MFERRVRRSKKKGEALGLLLEAVRARSEISSIAVVNADGMVVSGVGTDHELAVLGTLAASVAHGEVEDVCERLTAGTDVFARAVDGPSGDALYLAALGQRVRRMPEAARSVSRILRVA